MVKKAEEIKSSSISSATVAGLSLKKKKKLSKGAWTAEEDQKLKQYVKIHGDKKWRDLPSQAGLNRCGKSCRLRWLNYLRPGIKRGNITEDEEDLIIRLHNLLGNRWSLIAGRLPGRTDNEIKNHWNTHLSKKPLTISELNLKLHQKLESKIIDVQPSSTLQNGTCNIQSLLIPYNKPSNELSQSCGVDSKIFNNSNTNELFEKNNLDIIKEFFEGSSLMECLDPLVDDLMIVEEGMFQNLQVQVQEPYGNYLQVPTGIFDYNFSWNNMDLMM